jgi:hypothetical protein
VVVVVRGTVPWWSQGSLDGAVIGSQGSLGGFGSHEPDWAMFEFGLPGAVSAHARSGAGGGPSSERHTHDGAVMWSWWSGFAARCRGRSQGSLDGFGSREVDWAMLKLGLPGAVSAHATSDAGGGPIQRASHL